MLGSGAVTRWKLEPSWPPLVRSHLSPIPPPVLGKWEPIRRPDGAAWSEAGTGVEEDPDPVTRTQICTTTVSAQIPSELVPLDWLKQAGGV